MKVVRLLLVLAALASIAPLPLAAADPDPPADRESASAPDARGPVVTQGNLLASERYWPYQVALTQRWQPAGTAAALAKGTRGVLIRIESSGLARVDFGRDGRHAVPVAVTDLLANANRIRQGELSKQAPNFALAIGPRLIRSDVSPPKLLGLDEAAAQRGFLCVFADPTAEDFAALAKSLAPLAGRSGVLTVVFPHAALPDARIAEQLRAAGWPVPFVLDHLAEAYTRTLVPSETALPAVLLVSNEGRLLYEASWKPERSAALTAALETGFGAISDARP